ncbi:YhcB family protein [Kaarinaea lacus]
MITWVLYLCIGVVIGGMAGFYFAKLDDFSKKQKQELEDKLQKSERELVEYKDQVTAHFVETANLINNMTESYQKVHEHLANGSVDLCNNAVEVNKLTISSNQLLSSTLKEKPNVEEVTKLADSEAPKNFKENNNNNTDDTEEMSDTSELGSSETETEAVQSAVADSTAPGSDNKSENPVLETMAVAEEDESAADSEEKSKSKNRLPGSRMVH